ncbi:hypothetical protein RhiirC2_775045 [Rhizophagus irregularis]|uniref:Uncharacterized protein n=1 Tax=Rhizophagus irregularis TaxID=588596 RepID=A0A2N1NK56_9GLOM|nr:hypothetical protein RhiirC2_775045 [Rhizophagus irregularis]
MNPIYLNHQFSDSENHGPNFNQNTTMETSSRMNISSAQHNNININPSNPQEILINTPYPIIE